MTVTKHAEHKHKHTHKHENHEHYNYIYHTHIYEHRSLFERLKEFINKGVKNGNNK